MNITLAEAAIAPAHIDSELATRYWGGVFGRSAPILCTSFGHLFLEEAGGAISFLDTWSAELHPACSDYDEFRERVGGDRTFFSTFFWTDLLAEILASGGSRTPSECFSPFVSPFLGGSLTAANFAATTLNAHWATATAELRALGRIE